MELYVRDVDLNVLCILDSFISTIWTARFNDVGDFEIQVSAVNENVRYLQINNYITRVDDDNVGIIETISFNTSPDEGDMYIVKGRFLAALLERRIIWNQTIFTNVFVENAIRQFITQNAINPTDIGRKIPKLVLAPSNGWMETIDSIQRTGDNLLVTMVELCKLYDYGFKIVINNNSQFEFKLYKGTDRSYAQSLNTYVIFSEEFDNLATNEYILSLENYSNVALVAGEGEGQERVTATVNNSAHSGLGRYELFVDARDLSTNGGEISMPTYINQLMARGKSNLINITEIFDSDVEMTPMFTYKKDFSLGDIVTIVSLKWGLRVNRQIIAITESVNSLGRQLIPTFAQ